MGPDHPEPEAQQRPASRRRLWLFRFVAVLVGLAPFVAFEGVCVLFDWGRPSLHEDPFVGFRSTQPLFVLNQERTRYEIPKSRQWYFRPASFGAKKAANEFRIFCLGGSTVEGEPFEPATAFPKWLEISLQAADSSRQWEVVNCGGISYATYRLVPILEEVLHYEPDLIIFCEGHNEFLEYREFDHIQRRGRLVNATLDVASRFRAFTLLREGYLRLQGISSTDRVSQRPILPTEVEALLDYRGGLEEYHHDEAWHDGVISHYRFTIHRIVQLARDAGVPIVLINPVSNFSDCPPFKSEHLENLTPDELEQWESLCEAARGYLHAEKRDLHKAAQLFDQACQLDPLYAGGFYNLAKCYDAAGEFEPARAAYLRAKDLDVCPLRILQPMNDAVLEIASETDTPLVDALKLFEQRSAHGIVGGDWLVDHMHPGFAGHQLLADALTEKMIEMGVVQPRSGWEAVKDDRYREHFDSLDPFYFERGMATLKRLRGWAQGRVDRRRPRVQESANPPSKSDNEMP